MMEEKELNKNGDRRGMSHNSQKNLHPRLKGNSNAKGVFTLIPERI